MAWFSLLLAGIFEVVWAVGLKHTDGFTRLYPSLFTLAAMAVSILLLAYSLKTLPIGTAYAIWTGIGAVGTVIYGVYFLGEPATLLRLSCIGLIILAIIGLKIKPFLIGYQKKHKFTLVTIIVTVTQCMCIINALFYIEYYYACHFNRNN